MSFLFPHKKMKMRSKTKQELIKAMESALKKNSNNVLDHLIYNGINWPGINKMRDEEIIPQAERILGLSHPALLKAKAEMSIKQVMNSEH